MSYIKEISTWIIGIFGMSYEFVTGNTDKAFQILLCLILLDIVTGLMKGIKKRRLKSAIMSMGIMKKAAILISIVFGALLDQLVNDGQPVFSTMMTWLAIGNEGLSITENLTQLGVAIPKAITERLGIIKDQANTIQKEKDE